jgi:GTP cyclohydrolase IIa
MIQLSILKISEYGPWTLTLGSDREHELQMLQASLYKEVQKLFSEKNCLVFLNRADEFFVVSNGLELDDHIQIQKSLEKLFDIRMTISIGYGDSPFEANLKAYEGKKNETILNKEHNIFGFVNGKSDFKVSIMHLDVDDLTSKRKTNSPYEISSIIFEIFSKMSKFFLERNSLTFFIGGDNFMVIASDDAKNSVQNFIDIIKNDDKISLNCGIGNGVTSREAVKLATKSLDTIREIRDSGKEKPEVYELSC